MSELYLRKPNYVVRVRIFNTVHSMEKEISVFLNNGYLISDSHISKEGREFWAMYVFVKDTVDGEESEES